jgi:hypothetical protein
VGGRSGAYEKELRKGKSFDSGYACPYIEERDGLCFFHLPKPTDEQRAQQYERFAYVLERTF